MAAGQRIGKQARVQSFLAAEADAQQLGVGELQEAGWRERADRRLEPIEGRFRGGERDLLLKNNVNQSREAGFANPEGRLAVGVDYADEIWISLSQLAYMRRE